MARGRYINYMTIITKKAHTVKSAMDERDPYPLTFKPVLRDYVWGGRRFESLYGRDLPPGIVAESWEISGHLSAPTAAENGSWAGRTLPEILACWGGRLVGSKASWALERKRFPLLVKLLDAQQDLSVQVHPDDTYALLHEQGELGKTEMWRVLHADPGARLILGVRRQATRQTLVDAFQAGRLDSVLSYIPVKAGDAVSIPAGTIHALLAGVVVTEIQQNSDATYRVHDWGRLGADGRPRPLHLEKALDVIDLGQVSPGIVTPRLLDASGGIRRFELVRNRHFVVEELHLADGVAYDGFCDGSTLEIWACIEGEALVEWTGAPVSLPAIRYILLPAALGEFAIRATTQSSCLRVYLP